VRRENGDCVPDARWNVDTCGIASQNVRGGDSSGVVECEECELTVKDQKGFRLGRIAVPMGRNVRAPDHHVQEPVRVLVHAGVKIMVHPQPGSLARAFDERPNQG